MAEISLGNDTVRAAGQDKGKAKRRRRGHTGYAAGVTAAALLAVSFGTALPVRAEETAAAATENAEAAAGKGPILLTGRFTPAEKKRTAGPLELPFVKEAPEDAGDGKQEDTPGASLQADPEEGMLQTRDTAKNAARKAASESRRKDPDAHPDAGSTEEPAEERTVKAAKERTEDPEEAAEKENETENETDGEEAGETLLWEDLAALDSVRHVNGYALWNTDYTLSGEEKAALLSAAAAYRQEDLDFSFCLLDITTGQLFTCNTGLTVYSASAIKAPYIVSCLAAGKEAERDMYLAGHISDNDAYRRIREKYGDGIFRGWLKDTGCSPRLADGRYTHLTAMDLARMWLKMYAYMTGEEEESSFAKVTFEHSAYSALDEAFGDRYTVYSKAGWIAEEENPDYNVYNAAGIVLDEEHPYILAITSTAHATTEEAVTLAKALGDVEEGLSGGTKEQTPDS